MTPSQPTTDAAALSLAEKLARVSGGPGVYLMKDAEDRVIYIGKARSLKKRLSSYFARSGHPDAKTGVLVAKIADFETIVTATEKEALILESNLIKRHKPRYNVVLKDDKRYPSLRLDLRHPYPRLSIVRKISKDGALYFGPYASAQAVRQTLKVVNKTFMLRKCTDREFKTRTRPCLHCQMQSCLAPCCRDVDRGVYEDMVKDVILFLKGRTPDLIRKIRSEMNSAARRQDYERAASLRDRMFALEKTLEKQVAVSTDFMDRDVIATARTARMALVTLLSIRGGFLQGSRSFNVGETVVDDEELVATFIRQYYADHRFVPKEILLPVVLEDAPLIEEWLQGIKHERVRLIRPQRGEKTRLIVMARENAAKELKERIDSANRGADLLQRLQKRMALSRLPEHIECYDNSNLFGAAPVAGRVVFKNGKPDKGAYRIYRIRAVAGPDDYATMAEVLRRRFDAKTVAEPLPDLLLVDGGKGQLNVAQAVIADLALPGRFDVAAIAKKDENKGETEDKIYIPGRLNPVGFGREADLLLFLQRIRDEAHRFAVSFHRRQRNKAAIASELDAVPGIGGVKKKALLQHFKSVARIRSATAEALSEVPGIDRALARRLLDYLNRRP
jgi:excinuclease ABC subunit C